VADTENIGRETFKILVADDEESVRETLVTYLETEGYDLRTADSGVTALKVIEEFKPQVVLLDIRMPDMDGLQCLRSIMKLTPGIAVVVMSGFASEQIARKSLEIGAFEYINKPISFEHLIKVLQLVKISKFVEYM